jgi:hypothetical protein
VGLSHGTDLAAWSRWQRSRQPLTRRARAAVDGMRRGGRAAAVLTRGGAHPSVVVALDATTPTALQALLLPVLHLPPEEVAVVSHGSLAGLVPEGWAESTGSLTDLLASVVRPGAVVLALGHYLSLGAAALDVARGVGARFLTVQHGLLTPHAPPLAASTTLLAWSEADADFWAHDRPDVTRRIVGSQLLWSAATRAAGHAPEEAAPAASTPVFLGQLHGVELPRAVAARAAEGFCLETGATYRPHPAETDRRSRATHRRWERAGIRVDRSGSPLAELRSPVVSIFSTGVLEAAAAGTPAWVHLPDPPPWVREFWRRYGLSSWGDAPTPSPERPDLEPSRAVARAVQEMMAP